MLRSFLFALLLVACAVPDLPAADFCQTTLQPSPSFVPPAPYPENPSSSAFWYGTTKLWTQLPINGVWHATESDGGYVTKLIFRRQGFDWRTEQNPNLIVTARRVDADAPAVAVAHAEPVFVTTKAPAIMVGFGIPTPGCWDVTAFYGGVSLEFMVSVQR